MISLAKLQINWETSKKNEEKNRRSSIEPTLAYVSTNANYVVSGKKNLQLQKNGLAAGLYNVTVATIEDSRLEMRGIRKSSSTICKQIIQYN